MRGGDHYNYVIIEVDHSLVVSVTVLLQIYNARLN